MRDAALRRNDGVIADLAVADHADLAGENDAVADFGGPRKADLGAQQGIFSHGRSVADLHQVVDLDAAPDASFAHAGAVDAGVGLNLDVIFDDHRARLGNFVPAPGFGFGEAEAVGANHHAILQENVVTDAAILADDALGVREKIVADPDSAVDHDVGQKYGRVADGYVLANHDVGSKVNITAEPGSGMDDGGGMNSGSVTGRMMEKFERLGEGEIGVLRPQHGRRNGGKILRHNDGGRLSGAGGGGVLGIRNKGEFTGTGLIDAVEAGDFGVGRTIFQLRVQGGGNGGKFHGCSFVVESLVVERSFYGEARDASKSYTSAATDRGGEASNFPCTSEHCAVAGGEILGADRRSVVMKLFGREWLLLAVVGVLCGAVAGQSYTIKEIGVLEGDNESNGFWLNASGAVVGCSDTANGEGYPCTGTTAGQHGFYWTKSGGLEDLGTLPGGNISGAIGLNDSGEVVGYSNTSTKAADLYNFVAFDRMPTGEIKSLGTLASGDSSCAFSVNSSGEIAGDSFENSTVVDAVRWSDTGKIKNLGALHGAIFTAGLGINESGEIVGESVFEYSPTFTSHAFKWISGEGKTDLGTLSGGDTSIANAINSSGTVVGQSNSGSIETWHAVKWNDNDKIKDLGVLAGGTYSVAFGINDSSDIVGYGNIADNSPHAFLWTASQGMQDLNDLIAADSGWVLINANAINASGQITGYGTKNGRNRAFLLTPKN